MKKLLFCTMLFVCCVILAVSFHEMKVKKIAESNQYFETLEKRKVELINLVNKRENYKTRNKVIFIRTENSDSCPSGKEYIFKDDREQLYKMCNVDILELEIGKTYYYKGGWIH